MGARSLAAVVAGLGRPGRASRAPVVICEGMSLDANFEEPLVDLRRQIQELENYPARPGVE